MSLFDRLFKRTEPRPQAQVAARAGPKNNEPAVNVPVVPASHPAAEPVRVDQNELSVDAKSVSDIIRVEEIGDAEFYAGDLFRRRFRSDPPDYPKHYVAFYRQGRTRYLPVGYIHYSQFEDSYLCGGMVIDDRLYRRIPAPHRKLIKGAGGIAEIMLRETFARLSHAAAIWGYVGDKQAEEVDLRAGFRHTHHPYIMVVWNRDLAEAEKAARLERVIALGHF